jgi:hypothetical protein
MKRQSFIILSTVAFFSFIGVPALASAPRCVTHHVSLNGGDVPANLPAIGWTPSQRTYLPDYSLKSSAIALIVLPSEQNVEVLLQAQNDRVSAYAVSPSKILQSGVSYRFEADDLCDENPANDGKRVAVVSFKAVEASAYPTSLGKLSSSPQDRRKISILTGDNMVFDTVAAVGLTLEMSADSAPWKNALEMQTYVDGKSIGLVGAPRRWGDGPTAEGSYASAGTAAAFDEVRPRQGLDIRRLRQRRLRSSAVGQT